MPLMTIGDSLEPFFGLWKGAAAHQDMDTLRHALKIGRGNHRQRSRRSRSPLSKVEVWRQDLEPPILSLSIQCSLFRKLSHPET